MFYKFRKELLKELQKSYLVELGVPMEVFTEELSLLTDKMIDLPICRRSKNPLKELSLLWSYFRIIYNEKPDIVMTYTIKPNIYGGLVCRFLKIPYIMNITGLGSAFNKRYLRSIIEFLYRIASKSAKSVFFQNNANMNYFTENIICKEIAIIVPGSGVNLDEFCPDNKMSDNFVTFTFIGRMMREKGIDELLEAAKIINDHHTNTRFNLIGPIEDKIYEEIFNHIADDRIQYIGLVKDVKPYIASSNCIVNPSYHEGLSNVLLEGAAMARPLIASDIPGCSEIIQNEYNGFLIKKGSSQDLVNAIEKFLKMGLTKQQEFGENSRILVEGKFCRKRVTNIYLDKVNELIGGM